MNSSLPFFHVTFRAFAFCALVLSLLEAQVFAAARPPSKKVITLDDAYNRTLATDQSVRTAYIEIRKANLLPWSALAKFGPRLSGSVNLSHSETAKYENPSTFTVDGSQNTGLSLQQPLIDFTFFPAYRLGKLSARSAQLQYRLTVRSVLFGVAKAYYEVLKQQKIVALDKETLDLANGQLKLSQDQYDAGAVSRVDVLRGQSTLESARQTLISDQNILELDRNTLANTLNLQPVERDFEVAQPADAIEKKDSFEVNLKLAYANREDCKVGAISIEQNVEQRNEVLGQYAPTVSAQLAQNWDYPVGSARSDSWSAGLTVQVPIFTGGQREIDLRTAHHNIDEAKINLETTQKTVEADVKTTWLQVGTLRQTISSLKAQVEANTQNYKDLENQYQAGAATSLDTQSALNQLASSRTTLITEIYAYQVALRDLERSVAAFQNERVKNARLPLHP